MINLTSESETIPKDASTGRLPENLDVPQEKNRNNEKTNSKSALHTSQRSQGEALKEKNLKQGTNEHNPNVTNYLGSEKLNENLSDNVKKYSHHKQAMQETEEIPSDDNFVKNPEKEPKRHEGTSDGDGGSLERDDSKSSIRYDFE